MRGGRKAVLNAAIRVFADKGYAGSSIREICRVARVTKPVLYYYFRSKEHLYQEIMADSFEGYLLGLLGASTAGGTVRERLVRIAHDDLHSVKQDPVRTQFIFRMLFSPEGKRPYFDYVRETERHRKVIAEVFQEGIDRGELRGNARELATALMGMDLIAILENLFTGRSTLTLRTARKHVGLLMDGAVVR
jgi:AcrR family transcriptional regulator